MTNQIYEEEIKRLKDCVRHLEKARDRDTAELKELRECFHQSVAILGRNGFGGSPNPDFGEQFVGRVQEVVDAYLNVLKCFEEADARAQAAEKRYQEAEAAFALFKNDLHNHTLRLDRISKRARRLEKENKSLREEVEQKNLDLLLQQEIRLAMQATQEHLQGRVTHFVTQMLNRGIKRAEHDKAYKFVREMIRRGGKTVNLDPDTVPKGVKLFDLVKIADELGMEVNPKLVERAAAKAMKSETPE